MDGNRISFWHFLWHCTGIPWLRRCWSWPWVRREILPLAIAVVAVVALASYADRYAWWDIVEKSYRYDEDTFRFGAALIRIGIVAFAAYLLYRLYLHMQRTAMHRQILLAHLASGLRLELPLERICGDWQGQPPPVARVLARAQHRLQQGRPLHQALAHTAAFLPRWVHNGLALGERHHCLPAIIAGLRHSDTLEEEHREAWMRSIWYPVLLLIGYLIALTWAIHIVLPSTWDMFAEVNGGLLVSGASTESFASLKMLILMIDVLIIGGFFFLLGCILPFPWTTDASFAHTVRNRLPLLGRRQRRAILARFLMVAGVMMRESACDITLACDAVLGTQHDPDPMEQRLARRLHTLEHGKPLSEALTGDGDVHPWVVALLRQGERDGDLPAAMIAAGSWQRDRLLLWDARIMRVVVPMVVIGIGALVYWAGRALFDPYLAVIKAVLEMVP